MTDSLSEQRSIPHPPLWVKLLRRTAIGLAIVLAVSSAAGGTWLWFFVNNELGLLVEKELTKLIDRPVKIGPVEKFYLTGLRVGVSTLTATETDPDFAEIPTVKIGFDPLMLLLNRTLNLKISLINPTFYIEQDIRGNWLQFNLNQLSGSDKTLNINLKTIKVENGQVILLPNGTKRAELLQSDRPMVLQPFGLEQVRAKINFFHDRTETKYQLTAQPTSGGYLKIKGYTNLSNLDTKLNLKGDDLAATEIIPLIPQLPFKAESGELNFRLNLNLQASKVLSWQGKANFSQIDGQLASLSQPISDASGKIKFTDLQLSLENTQAVYGQLPLKVNGTIDTKSDYNLTINIPSLNLDRYINTLELTLPVPISGAVRSQLKITGSLPNPILSGEVVSSQPVKVDLIDVMAASARFKLAGNKLEITDIEAEPAIGGLIYGRGNIQLTEIPEIGFYLIGENLPGDAIGQLYAREKPPIEIGRINGTTTVLGQIDRPTTLVKWRSPEAMYPGSGEVTITKETTLFRNTIFQIASGTVSLTGSITPAKNRWQAFLNAQNIELNQLTDSTNKGGSRTATTPENPAILAGGIRLSGQLSILDPANIQGSGELELTTPDATVTGRGTLDKGQWRASLGVETLPGKALRIHELAPDLPLPMELGSGTLELSGTVDSFGRQNALETSQSF